MGLFDQIAGQALGALGNAAGGTGAQPNQLLSLVTTLINQSGGLEGLIKQFAAKGLASQAASWVGTGQNLPVNADQITQVLGADKIQQLAQQAGLPTSAVSSGLADLLPKVVDKLTPSGAIGGNDAVQSGLQSLMQGGLGNLLGR